MFYKIIVILSSILYRLHSKIDCWIKQNSPKNGYAVFEPYQVKVNEPKTNIKIIHVNGNFIIGGSSQLIVDIIEGTSHYFKHKVIVPVLPNPLPYKGIDIYKFDIFSLTNLYEFLKEEKPDLVHIHFWVRYNFRFDSGSIWYTTIFNICKDLGIRVIQNVNVPTNPFSSINILQNIFVSNYVLENFNDSNVPSNVIYPGSDFKHFFNKDVESLPGFCIGMVYRLDKDKLNEDAIEVFIRTVKKSLKVKCLIVGDGEFLELYKKRVSEENLIENFIFTSMVSYSELPEYYKKMSVFITPVHDESFGQVTPFAMSMGLAVAGYKTGALPEILGSSETLVDYGDIDGLVNIILELLNNEEKKVAIGKNNQIRAHQHFSVEKMVESYLQLYNKVLHT